MDIYSINIIPSNKMNQTTNTTINNNNNNLVGAGAGPSQRDLISARRESVLQAYNSAEAENRLHYLEGDDKATAEYIFPNQKEDAMNIVDKFYKNNRRVISIQKKTKVGADGLMIEIAKLLTTHNDDTFVVNLANVRIITGMSNAGWEKDMIDKAPNCFKDKIFHHGKLSRADLMSISNGLIIIDELDTGDKEAQVLHNTLNEAGVLNVEHMKRHNNRFVFISATMIKELYDLYRWGDLHELYKMTIPASYIGHKDFLDLGIIQEFYALDTQEEAERWVQEDVIDNYKTDYRVHLVRVNKKTVDIVQTACIRKGVNFRNHTSTDRLTTEEIKEFFKEPLTQHIVLGVKGFFRRANLIPNNWKLRIGATHELYTKKVDNNVQIQGLPGRMTGYWRDVVEGGYKTGPHRTSIRAIEEYEQIYNNPFGNNSYRTAGFVKKEGKVSADPTMVTYSNVGITTPQAKPAIVGIPDKVPIILIITAEEYASFKKKKGKWDYATILNVIKRHKPKLAEELERLIQEGGQDSTIEPTEGTESYTSLITSYVEAERDGETRWSQGNKTKENNDLFQTYLDKAGKRVVVSFYYGKTPNTDVTMFL